MMEIFAVMEVQTIRWNGALPSFVFIGFPCFGEYKRNGLSRLKMNSLTGLLCSVGFTRRTLVSWAIRMCISAPTPKV